MIVIMILSFCIYICVDLFFSLAKKYDVYFKKSGIKLKFKFSLNVKTNNQRINFLIFLFLFIFK